MNFDPCGDLAQSGYLQNSLQLTEPEEVKRLEHISFESSIEEAIDRPETTKKEYILALSSEMQCPFKGHLDNSLHPFVKPIASRNVWPEMSSGIKGQDGLDKEDITCESLNDPEIEQRYRVQRYNAPDYQNDRSTT